MSVRDDLYETLEPLHSIADCWISDVIKQACDELDALHRDLSKLTADVKFLQIENKRLIDALIILSNSTFYSNIPTDTEFTYDSYYNQVDACMEGEELKNGNE